MNTRPNSFKASRLTAAPQPPPADYKPPMSYRLARLLSGFNLNSVLLLIVIILLGVLVARQSPQRAYSDYEYWVANPDREDVSERGARTIPKGYEYVGPLCNDGINGAWILIRKPKD